MCKKTLNSFGRDVASAVIALYQATCAHCQGNGVFLEQLLSRFMKLRLQCSVAAATEPWMNRRVSKWELLSPLPVIKVFGSVFFKPTASVCPFNQINGIPLRVRVAFVLRFHDVASRVKSSTSTAPDASGVSLSRNYHTDSSSIWRPFLSTNRISNACRRYTLFSS